MKSNNFMGGYIATKHLIEQGCKNIAFLAGYYYVTSCERYEGYALALQEAGIEIREEYRLWNSKVDSYADGAETYRVFLKEHPEVDGLFCFNDRIVVGAMSACMELKREVGKEIALVGYDNSPICTSFLPKVTSVDFRSYDIGIQAAQMLHQLSRGTLKPEKKKVILAPYLVERESSHLDKE